MSENTQESSGEKTLPKGTVTFLSTDIENSTRLLEHLREQYAALLEEHRQLLRVAFAKWNGIEIDTQGDSFFVAFPRALDAIQCVAESQRQISAHAWPGGVTLRIRMGLHTGEPIVTGTGYVGMDVHRAARIAFAGYGGQVLLSQTTRDLVYQDLPTGLSLQDLGDYKLKDIRHSQKIYQLDIKGLPNQFPTLKTLSAEEQPPAPGEPPYKGLQYFDEPDAAWFFGRQAVTARLVETVLTQRFLAVIGASGSGKSSVVRAGLVPALRKDPITSWRIHVITPTAHPLEALAVSLTRNLESTTATSQLIDDLAVDARSLYLYAQKTVTPETNERLLVIIDQFEELFTLCRSEAERQVFIDNLLAAVTQEGSPVTSVITLRADFYERVAQYTNLRELVASHQVYIGAMTAAELNQAIAEPASRGGWELSPGLVELILHDIGAADGCQPEPGALPLLSHALLETWLRRRGNLMNLRAYTESGGVRGAIAHTADIVFNQQLTVEQQEIARSIFLRLTELGEGTQDSRRRISITELIPPGPALETEQIRQVLLKLVDARLITTSEGTVEVAHEALIREWPALREWLAQDREGLRLHRHLTEAAQEWELLERDPGALYRGARLAQAVEWALANPRQLNAQEQAFLEASRQAAEREEAEREAQRQHELEVERQRAAEQAAYARSLRRRATYLLVVLVVALGLAAAAVFFANRAGRSAELAAAGQAQAENSAGLAATSEAHAMQQQALAEDREAARATQQSVAEEAKRNAEQRALEAYTRELSQAAEANLEKDPELSMLLALEAISITQVSDLPVSLQMEDMLHRATQAQRARMTINRDSLWAINVSPDGSLLATASKYYATLWDAGTGQEKQSIYALGIQDTVFSPDGRRLALGAGDSTRIVDLASGETILRLPAMTSGAGYLAFSPDGLQLATVDYNNNAIRIWDVSDLPNAGTLLLELPGQVGQVTFSPDGKKLATQGSDGSPRIWEVASGAELLTLPKGEFSGDGLAFSQDGATLAAVGPEVGLVTLYETQSGKPIATLCCHADIVWTIDTSPDGALLATASSDGTAKIWDARTGRELFTLSGQMGSLPYLAFSPECAVPPQAPFTGCGRYLYTVSMDGKLKKWDVSPAGVQDLLTVMGNTAAFTLDSALAQVVYPTSPTRLHLQTWQLSPGSESQASSEYPLPESAAKWMAGAVEYLPDQATALLAREDGSLLEIGPGEPPALISYTIPISDGDEIKWTFVTADGLRLVTANPGERTTQLFDIQTGKVNLESYIPASMDISRDGKLIALGARLIEIRNASDGKIVSTLSGHEIAARTVAFSPNDLQLASGGNELIVIVWNVHKGTESYRLSTPAVPIALAWSMAGDRLAAGLTNGSLIIWDVDPDSKTTRQVLHRFTGLGGPVNNIGFSPDGTIAFAGSDSANQVRFYALSLDELVSLARGRLTRTWSQDECRQYRIEDCPAPVPIAHIEPPISSTEQPGEIFTATAETPPEGPSPRLAFGFPYDNESDRMILFGGQASSIMKNCSSQTWVFDLTAGVWTDMAPESAPQKNCAPSLVYDSESDRVIMYGGAVGDEFNIPQTWAYDFNINTWQQISDGPEFHLGASLAYDSESDRVILFGGQQVITNRYFNDTWAYDFNTDTWTEMKPLGSPAGRNFGGMAYDAESDRVILVGGSSYSPSDDPSVWAYDYNSDSWEQMPYEPGSMPGLLYWLTITYDEKADRVILYGGLSLDGQAHDETWAYDYNNNTWTDLKPAANPGTLIEFAITYDSAADLVVMFGGQINDLFDKLSNQIWTYDYDTNTWTDVTPK